MSFLKHFQDHFLLYSICCLSIAFIQETDRAVEVDSINADKEQQQSERTVNDAEAAELQPKKSKRHRTVNMRLADYQYEAPSSRSNYTTTEATVQPQSSSTPVEFDQCSSLRKTYELLLDNFVTEIDNRFGAMQSDIAAAVSATHPASTSFMVKLALQPLADLANLTLDDTEVELARRFFTNNNYDNVQAIAQSSIIRSMPTVQGVIQLSRTIAVSTAACESSFSTLKRVLTPHRMSMLHSRKADLMIISFERDIADKINSDGELLRRIWNSGPDGRRRLQLY